MDNLYKMINEVKDKEVVIFNSPLYRERFDDGETYLPPLGQGYILTYLKKRGITAGLIDAVYHKLGTEEIIRIINHGVFQTVGFNVFSINMNLVKDIIAGINRAVHVVLGGKAVGAVWRDIVSWNTGQKLSLIIGEGEWIFPDIVRGTCTDDVLYGTDRCRVYQVGTQSCYFPSDLDKVVLDRSLFLDRAVYNHYGKLEQCIIASRGCIYRCAFCGGSTYANRNIPVRFRSSKNIQDEIHAIIEQTPEVQSIRLLDDLFMKDVDSIQKALDIFSKFPRIYWRAMAHVQSFDNAEPYIEYLKESGCDELFVGIESGSSKIRKMIHKEGSLERVKEVIKLFLTTGIDVKGYFMCGFPKETEDDLEQTLQLAEEIKQYAACAKGKFRAVAFRFRPYHGTELYDQLIRENYTMKDYETRMQKGTKTQYNFSAGNFSCMADAEIDNFLERITDDGYHFKLPEMQSV